MIPHLHLQKPALQNPLLLPPVAGRLDVIVTRQALLAGLPLILAAATAKEQAGSGIQKPEPAERAIKEDCMNMGMLVEVLYNIAGRARC